MSEAFDGKTLLKITNKINNFKSLIRKTSDNNDEQTIDDLLNIINKNTELTDFIESEPLNKSYIGYKTIILKKIQDSECLKLQTAVNAQTSQASESGNEDGRNVLTNVQITNTNANLHVFQSQAREMFENNHKFITKVGYNESSDNLATFMIITNSSEAPNFKIMGKNFLNNLLQQFVFENNPKLYLTKRFKQDVYKMYIDNDGSACRSFIDKNHIDLDMGLEGLKFAGDMVSELLDCKIKKVRIFCYFEDVNNYIPAVLDEFFTNLQTTLLEINASPYVEQEFEFINIFDGQASNHNLTETVFSEKFTEERKYEVFSNSLCLNLLHKGDNAISTDSDNSKGEYYVTNDIFLKFLEVMEWNVVIGNNVLHDLLNKLELFVDKKEYFSFLESIFVDIIINFFQSSVNSPLNCLSASLIQCHLGDATSLKVETLYEDLVNDITFQKFIEDLVLTGSAENLEFCKQLLTDKNFLFAEFSSKLYKTTPTVNTIFKNMIDLISKVVLIDSINIIRLYSTCLDYVHSQDKLKCIQAISKISSSIDKDSIENILDESHNVSVESSDMLLVFKTFNDKQILQTTVPNYRKNYQNLSYLENDSLGDEPLLLTAYEVLLDYYDHLDIPLKMKEMYTCYKHKMIEKLGEDSYSEDNLVGAFIYVINMMLYSGYYNFDKWTLIKQVINGL